MRFNNSSGQASRFLLILAVIVVVAAIIVFLVMKMAEQPTKVQTEPAEEIELPVYEETLGEIKFIFESAVNKGGTLYASDIEDGSQYDKDLTTTEKFIEVKIGAQNIGKVNLEDGSWDIENIIDSEGREFVPLDDNIVGDWLPEEDLCGTLLKPAFNPTACIKIYEVAKGSTGLKIRVLTGKDNSDELDENDAQSALIDLIVTK